MSGAFPQPLETRQVGPRHWKLLSPLLYVTHYETITVPTGYVTDYATIPRALHWLLPASGDYSGCAVIHDYLLTDSNWPHRVIDRTFRNALKDAEVPFARRWVLWTGVRWGSFARSSYARREWLRDAPLVLLWTLPLILVTGPAWIGVSWGLLWVKLARLLSW